MIPEKGGKGQHILRRDKYYGFISAVEYGINPLRAHFNERFAKDWYHLCTEFFPREVAPRGEPFPPGGGGLGELDEIWAFPGVVEYGAHKWRC